MVQHKIVSYAQLPSEIPEEDRSFFLVLDIVFSQYHLAADLGYYYEAECEDTFSFRRFQVASNYFYFYQNHRSLHPEQRFFVKYVNVTLLAPPSMDTKDFHRIHTSLLQEFNLFRNYCGLGLMDVFLICCRVPNIFYIFMQRPDETLEEYLIRHNNNTLQYYSSKLKSFRQGSLIPMRYARFIMKSVATTLLELHKRDIFHGRISTNSIFIIKNKDTIHDREIKSKNKLNQPSHESSEEDDENLGISVKLSNMAFAEILNHNNNKNNKSQREQQIQNLKDVLRTRELVSLYDVVMRIAECVEFVSIKQRETFLEMASILITPRLETESPTKTEIMETGMVMLPKSRLATFIESLSWLDCN